MENGNEDDYSDDEEMDGKNESHGDNLKEDTINTQKIEQMVEEDMKEHERLEKEMIHDKERISVDELDMEGTGELDADGERIAVARNNHEDNDIEEYSYHDEASLSNDVVH